jgi:arylsulfatase A-like enzyme
MLKKRNYNTAIVGKWNLGLESPNTPNEKGFDLFHGFLDDMMDDYYSHLRHGSNYMRKNQDVASPKGHATDIFTNWAVDFIQNQQKETNPFFLYLAYNAPHTPIQPKEEWLEKIRKRQPGINDKRAKLLGLIEHMDDGIGKVISALKQSGKYNNTLIIFMSDNGGKLEDSANNGNLRGGKGGVYEGSLRVPALFVWKGHITPESVSEQRAATMDIFPTIGEIVNSTDTMHINGVSLLPILTGKSTVLKPRPLFFSRREGNLQFGGLTIQTIIDDQWKLLQNSPYQNYELYNLLKDPQELQNVIKLEPDRYKKMLDMLILQIKKAGSMPWQKPAEN